MLFRSPEDGRFVIVMSSDPDYFFQKIAALSRFGGEQGDGSSEREVVLDDVRRERIRILGEIAAMRARTGGGQ